MGVQEVLKSAHRPLTAEEIVTRCTDKNRSSVYKELKTLRKHKLIIKLELKVSVGEFEIGKPIVLYSLLYNYL